MAQPGARSTEEQLEVTVVSTFREMPGLTLHLAQAARLLDLRIGACQTVLDALVRKGRLRRVSDGRYGNS